MRRALITTTINVPENLRAWREVGMNSRDVVIVAGDLKTPHAAVRDLLDELPGENIYLHPDDQRNYAISDPLGWNTIQRRNVALLEAIRLGAEIITTVDDDNYPVANTYFADVDRVLRGGAPYTLAASTSGWWNAGSLLEPQVTVRGYPLSRRHEVPEMLNLTELDRAIRVGVVASLWLGDPDIDAVERIVTNPEVKRVRMDSNVVLAPGTWCPFNTQSTTFVRELAPLMFMWPHVGRYDDIWASLLTQRVAQELNYQVSFGYPLVHQARNEHDLVRDLEAELLGMRLTDLVAEQLRQTVLPADVAPLDALRTCFVRLTELNLLPTLTTESFDLWLYDLETVMK